MKLSPSSQPILPGQPLGLSVEVMLVKNGMLAIHRIRSLSSKLAEGKETIYESCLVLHLDAFENSIAEKLILCLIENKNVSLYMKVPNLIL